MDPNEYGLVPEETWYERTKQTRSEKLSIRQRYRGEAQCTKAYSIILQTPKITNQQLGEIMGVTRRMAARYVERLVKCGMLESHVRYVPGFTKHPLVFRELKIPNALPESQERLESNAQPRSGSSESDSGYPKKV